jgi:hypothetical protein
MKDSWPPALSPTVRMTGIKGNAHVESGIGRPAKSKRKSKPNSKR